MSIPRRDFLKYSGVAAATAGLPTALVNAAHAANDPMDHAQTPATDQPRAADSAPSTAQQKFDPVQKLHPDYQSNNPGTEYFFLGNGLITAAVQTSQSPEAGTHCGILLMSPEHFGRKASTFLYHPERGLINSLVTVAVNGTSANAHAAAADVKWSYPDSIPTVTCDWRVDSCTVHEELYCPIDEPALVRTVTITNTTGSIAKAMAYISLYPNLMFFDEYAVDRTRMTLEARGFATMRLFSNDATRVGDRHLYFDIGDITPGASRSITIVLTLNRTRAEFEEQPLSARRTDATAFWNSGVSLHTNDSSYDHLFRASQSSLRAAVARSGKMDGGIWQYNLEWVRDQSMVASATAMMGHSDIAESLLRRMLTYSVDEQGGTVDASRTRPREAMELDQNGELLYALHQHWMWTGDDKLIREHWEKIARLADYVLQPVFRDPSIGLLKNTREFWERDAAFGVNEGYELTYQMWNILGLAMAAEMAEAMNQPEHSRVWQDASELMKKSFLTHPEYSLVHEKRFIKRRNADGTPQFTFEPKNRKSMPQGMPLNVETVSYCDPDSSSVFPIVFGLVDARGEIAKNTLASMEVLWNQRWSSGGYGRYNVTSEPDSPGAWPLGTMFIARAALEAGDDKTVVRALSWLRSVKGGRPGTWLEFYGDRPVPPLPPVGIVVWNWAEVVMFFMHNMLGVRPEVSGLVIRPRLFSGVETVDARIPVRGKTFDLKIRRAEKKPHARVNGKEITVTSGSIRVSYADLSGAIEFFV